MKVKILSKNGPKVVDLNRRKAIRERCLNCAGWASQRSDELHAFKDCRFISFSVWTGESRMPRTRAKAIN